MTAYLLFNHLLNFMAPAAVVALLLMIGSRVFGAFFIPKRASAHSFIARTAIIFIVSLVVLAGGLVLFGHDGTVMTYGAMVLAASGTLWALQRQ